MAKQTFDQAQVSGVEGQKRGLDERAVQSWGVFGSVVEPWPRRQSQFVEITRLFFNSISTDTRKISPSVKGWATEPLLRCFMFSLATGEPL